MLFYKVKDALLQRKRASFILPFITNWHSDGYKTRF